MTVRKAVPIARFGDLRRQVARRSSSEIEGIWRPAVGVAQTPPRGA